MAKSTAADLLLFALTSVAALALQRKGVCSMQSSKRELKSTEEAPTSIMLNSAFVFVKPHANTSPTQALVRTKLVDAGITILSESEISGKTIDEDKLIDQHYYAIASKATILPASQIPVPTDKFEESFGETWEDVLTEKRAANAMEACELFGCSPDELNEAWGKSEKVVKFGGGFYCGLVSMGSKKLFVFNAFFMSMRSKFVGETDSIHCFEVQWDPSTMSWKDFRNKLLGPTDPSEAPSGSIRRTILESYKELGLKELPNKGDNGVHASASPFEGLAEKQNWLKHKISEDKFGKALLDAGLNEEVIKEWSIDPRVELPDGSKGSVFDALEDMDAEECMKKLVELNILNEDTV